MATKPETELAELQSKLEALRARVIELETERDDRRRAEKALKSLLGATAGAVGEAYFPTLARSLAKALDARHVFVTEIAEEWPMRLQTLAVCSDGELVDNFEYDTRRTPCEVVVTEGVYYCPRGIKEQFPDDRDLDDLAAESFVGVRIEGGNGRAIGHICVLDDEPLADPRRALSILNLFAARAAVELERARAERQQQLLMSELDHRVKNTLATVLALAEQTLARSESLAEFAAAYTGRIKSMAIAHEMLARTSWRGADLEQLVQSIVHTHGDGSAERVASSGPGLRLPADVAPSVSMILHELTTNATKHGALSVDDGKVKIRWRREPGDRGNQRLRLSWEESGGPPVTPPTRHGVGMLLLDQMIGFQLKGESKLEFPATGFRCELCIPLGRPRTDEKVPTHVEEVQSND